MQTREVAPYTYEEVELWIGLLEGEGKVGFSMCGGKGEGVPSLVNQLIRGSWLDWFESLGNSVSGEGELVRMFVRVEVIDPA